MIAHIRKARKKYWFLLFYILVPKKHLSSIRSVFAIQSFTKTAAIRTEFWLVRLYQWKSLARTYGKSVWYIKTETLLVGHSVCEPESGYFVFPSLNTYWWTFVLNTGVFLMKSVWTEGCSSINVVTSVYHWCEESRQLDRLSVCPTILQRVFMFQVRRKKQLPEKAVFNLACCLWTSLVSADLLHDSALNHFALTE